MSTVTPIIQQLCDLGQRLWLDNITRKILDDGSLRRIIEEFSITGLTSNPTIFDEAIDSGNVYDEAIGEKARAGKSGEALFMELALEDLCRAADLFRGGSMPPTGSMAGCRWKCRRCWRRTRGAALRRPRKSMRSSIGVEKATSQIRCSSRLS